LSGVRIAYIVLAHTLPRQLRRLVDRLDGDHAVFLVHVDKHAPSDLYADTLRELAVHPRVTLVSRRSSRRTTFGQVSAPLDALAALVRRGDRFDFAILLSGQDYPLKPQAALRGFLADERRRCYLHAFPIEDPERSEWPEEATFRYRHWHVRVGQRRWSVPLNRRLPGRREPFGGSAYWALPRDAVECVLDTVEREPRLVRFFEHTFCPDEMFFQTILLNSSLRERVTTLAAPDCYGLHFIDWRPNRDRPETLDSSTLPRLQATPAFFARKFDATVDEAVLDAIDAELLGVPRGLT
jgi:hypothetical protein